MPLPDEQNDPVWELLKRARQDEASPFFSRNVIREVRKMESAPGFGFSARAWFAWLRRPMVAGGLATALAIASVGIVLLKNDPGESVVADVPPLVEPAPLMVADADFDPTSEVGSLEYLGQLMAVSDPAALDDAALADLLF